MQMQKLTLSLLIFIVLLSACQSNASVNSIPGVSQTKDGVTVSITNIVFSEKETVLTFAVRVNPDWGLDITADPFPQALHSNPVLFDEAGKQYTAISGTYGLPQNDETTGGVMFENVVSFPSIESQNIVFQTEIEISGIPISQPVSISIANHVVPDVWSIGPGITYSQFTDVPGQVKLVSQSGDTLELEFTFERVTNSGVRLGCLSFYPANQDWANNEGTENHFRECLADQNQIISKTGLALPRDATSPIPFHVTGSVIFVEPFRVSWSKTER
jgi:hypothetical protein